jgi:hypothetical protein
MSSVVISGDTSGAITLAAPAVAGTNTITLPASTGTVLTTGSPQSGGVIQVVSATTTASTSTSSTSYVATNLTASITPKFATSKIYIVVSGGEMDTNGTGQALTATIYRGSTNLAGAAGMSDSYGTLSRIQTTLSCSFLDSPATTSSTTYTVYIKANSGTVVFNANALQACMTLLEVAA